MDKLLASARTIAIQRFEMPSDGIHGLRHWERVLENARYLAKHSGADLLVVSLFAYFHDCCRESDGADPAHGARAATFVQSLKKGVLPITEAQLDLLCLACRDHEKGKTSTDPTIGTCWDADRLEQLK